MDEKIREKKEKIHEKEDMSKSYYKNVRWHSTKHHFSSFVNNLFENCDMSNSTYRNVKMSDSIFDRVSLNNCRFDHCDVKGLVINGVDVAKLLRRIGRAFG